MSATITDVARQAGVSVATVSRALRGLPNVAPETRARVVSAAGALHYVADPAASRLAARRRHTIGVVVPSLGQWYYATFLDAADEVIRTAGYDLLPFVLTGQESQDRFLASRPFRKRVDGLIVVDVPMSEEQLGHMASSLVPIVTAGIRTERFSSLSVDNVAAVRLATEHLLRLGHARIALIGGSQGAPFDYPTPRQRREGFLQAMSAAGHDNPQMIDAEVSKDGGVAAMHALVSEADRPTAVVALSDEMAFGALQVLHDVGLGVPGDMSIIGFDDHHLAECVGLTTVRQDVGLQGKAAAGRIFEAMLSRGEQHHEVVPTRLVVRRSTTAAPS